MHWITRRRHAHQTERHQHCPAIDLEVDEPLHLTVLDVSHKPSLLALPSKQTTARP
ncbi:hypothetical protein [Serratia symbiotica]|uniref:hypothetical protein n=1 Tax=Serratia symbiotica TaxID=138074 RepID=UPI000AEA7448|nr:hypothetical protein [Serratia symbiotica]